MHLLNVTDESPGETGPGAAGERAQVLDECDTFTIPLQKRCCCALRRLAARTTPNKFASPPAGQTRPQDPVLPSAAGIAAKPGERRPLHTGLWDGAAGEKPGVCQQDSTADRSSHPDTIWPIRRRQTNACGSFHPEASLGLSAKIAAQVARLRCCTLACAGGAR